MFATPLEWITPALLALLMNQSAGRLSAEGEAPAAPPTTVPAGSVLIYVGTYTSPEEKGIELLRMDPVSGALTPLGLVTELINPSFLILAPDHKFLFAVSEVSAEPDGVAAGFAVEPRTGKLTPINSHPSAGMAPCHLTLDADGRHLLIANYANGTVAVLPVDAHGTLGAPTATVQHQALSAQGKSPHAHGVYFDPTQSLLLVPDLGLDQVLLYNYDDQEGTLAPATPTALLLPHGAGPRHLAFGPTGRFLYVLCELNSTIVCFEHVSSYATAPTALATPAGTTSPPPPTPASLPVAATSPAAPADFRELQTISLLPKDCTQKSTGAEIVMHPSGRFLFASNRGHDSIAVFTRDPLTGRLTAAGHFPTHGKTPRHFALDPTGTLLLVANQNSNNITVFRIHPGTGALTFTGAEAKIHSPTCLLPMMSEDPPANGGR